MIRPLLLVFVAGSAIALACGVAYGVLHDGKESREVPASPESRVVETRDFAWNGEHRLQISVPAEVTYIQGPANKMVATGSRAILDKLKVEDGDIRVDVSCLTWSFDFGDFH